MVRVRNEARFLPEWVSYHSALGVEHFYVYDNGSTDDLAPTLSPLIAQGRVTLVSWPGRPISPSAELHFLSGPAQESSWVAMIDADEYVREDHPGRLLSHLRQCAAPALALNWRYFGSSGHEDIPPGLVIENFTRCDPDLDRHVKVILKPTEFHRYRNPHNHYYRGGRLAVTVDGRRVFASHSQPSSGSQLWLAHYVYRSKADYIAKLDRGYADAHGARDQARRLERVDSEFGRHNGAQVELSEPVREAVLADLRSLGYSAPFLDATRR